VFIWALFVCHQNTDFALFVPCFLTNEHPGFLPMEPCRFLLGDCEIFPGNHNSCPSAPDSHDMSRMGFSCPHFVCPLSSEYTCE